MLNICDIFIKFISCYHLTFDQKGCVSKFKVWNIHCHKDSVKST